MERYNPNFKQGVSPVTSKEMMEWFLKDVGIKSPFSYKQHTKDHGNNSLTTLYYAWESLLSYEKTEQYKGIEKGDRFKWFVQLEHLIKNNEMFWTLLDKVWTHGSQYLKPKQMFERYGRDKVSFNTKMDCVNYFNKMQSADFKLDETKRYRSPEVYKKRMNTSEDHILVYRTFKIKKGDTIRDGVTKFDKEGNLNLQNKGKGYSYTFVEILQ